MTLLFIQLSAFGLKLIKVENINIEINIMNMWFIKNTYSVFSLVANNNTIDKLKISFWTCLNVNKFSEYNNIGDYFYHDVMSNVYYYSKILRDIAIQKNNNVCDFLRLIKNTNYVNEDPENIVWKQNKGNIKNINVYDYAELVYQNIESFFNGKIENEKAIRILRNVKVQLSYSRNKKYLEFRKEAIDIVIEKLS